MQIAFGLRLTEYTLEPAPEFRPAGAIVFSAVWDASVCTRALKKFHHREPQLVTSPAESSRRCASFGKSLRDIARLARILL